MYIVMELRVQLFSAFTGTNREMARYVNLFRLSRIAASPFPLKSGYSRSIGCIHTTL